MGRNRFILVFIATVFILAGVVVSEGADVRVMVAVGLLDYGEDAKVVSVSDFNRYRPNYDEFQKLLDQSATIRDMVRDGWTLVHMEDVRDEYHVIVFETGTRAY
jgi:hypothetical protein